MHVFLDFTYFAPVPHILLNFRMCSLRFCRISCMALHQKSQFPAWRNGATFPVETNLTPLEIEEKIKRRDVRAIKHFRKKHQFLKHSDNLKAAEGFTEMFALRHVDRRSFLRLTKSLEASGVRREIFLLPLSEYYSEFHSLFITKNNNNCRAQI